MSLADVIKPETKTWWRLVFNSDIADIEANGVMNAVVTAYRKANLPKGVDVFRAPAIGGIVCYFSPQAAALLPQGANPLPCEKPVVSHMRKLPL